MYNDNGFELKSSGHLYLKQCFFLKLAEMLPAKKSLEPNKDFSVELKHHAKTSYLTAVPQQWRACWDLHAAHCVTLRARPGWEGKIWVMTWSMNVAVLMSTLAVLWSPPRVASRRKTHMVIILKLKIVEFSMMQPFAWLAHCMKCELD